VVVSSWRFRYAQVRPGAYLKEQHQKVILTGRLKPYCKVLAETNTLAYFSVRNEGESFVTLIPGIICCENHHKDTYSNKMTFRIEINTTLSINDIAQRRIMTA
jgi:hypothetical protein